MPQVFISYRRSDTTSGYASWIYERLAARFGGDHVFMDVDSLPLGVDFVEHLNRALANTDVALVLIGPGWLDAADEDGNRRLDDPDDFVRIEVATALRTSGRVIPVLVDGAQMPKAELMPEDLRPLARRQALIAQRQRAAAIQDLTSAIEGIEPHATAQSEAAAGSGHAADRRHSTLNEVRSWATATSLPPVLSSRLRAQSDVAFVGRARERKLLEDALAERGDNVRAVLISGEPGVGKTRLVHEVARAVHERGVAVAAGRCDSGLGLPYQPFVEVLDDLLLWVPSSVIEHHFEVHGPVLARIAPRLAAGQPELRSRFTEEDEGARHRLFIAVADLFAEVAKQVPLVLVLEDLHSADDATVLLLKHVLTMPHAEQLTIVGTFRPTELNDTPLGALLPELHREHGVQRITLEGLSEREVLELVEAHTQDPLGDDGHSAARRLCRDTAGNPFFLIQLMQAGSAVRTDAGHATSPDDPAHVLPVSLRDTITGRTKRLGAQAAAVLDAAAVAGDEFELALLRCLELAPDDELLAAIEAGLAAQLLVDLPGPAGRLAFVHALVPQVLRTELSSLRRRALHRRVARAMERVYGEDGGEHITALAHHWRAGCEPPAVEPALRATELAAQQAIDRLAPAEAARWYKDALELHAQLAKPARAKRCELLIRLGEAQRQAGDATFRETLLEAGRRAQLLRDTGRLVRSTLANTRGFSSATGAIDTERVEMLTAALDSIDPADSPERARLLAAQAVELAFCGERDTPRRLSDEALAMARRCGDDAALTNVLTTRFFAIWTPDTLPIRLSESEENVRLCDRRGDPVALCQALHWRANVCIEACDMASARHCIERVARLSNRLREPTVMWQAAYNEANLALALGRLDQAERLAESALELGQRSGQPDALPVYAAQLANLRFDQGRLDELVPLMEQVLTQHSGITGFRALLALARYEKQEFEEARRAIAYDADLAFQQLAYDFTWLTVVCVYAHICARLGELDPARALYSMLEPWRDQVALGGGGWGCVAHYLGMLATVLQDFAAAGDHFDHAARVHDQMGAPVWTARTQLETARMLALRRRRGDRDRSRCLAEKALARARELGCRTI